MKPIAEFKAQAEAVDERTFVAKWPHPFLLCDIMAGDQRLRPFKTSNGETRRIPPSFLASIRVTPALLAIPEARVVTIEKSPRNPYSNRIFVGRTATNDIVLSHQSISKSHAYFEFVPGGGWYVTDYGSRNGTRVPGQSLSNKQRAALSREVPIFFGSYCVVFLESGAFYALLREKT